MAADIILINGETFPVDPAESHLTAHIWSTNDHVGWSLQITASDRRDSEAEIGASLHFGAEHLTSWDALSNQRIEIATSRPGFELMLPDVPSSFFFGSHLFAYHHDLRFGVPSNDSIPLTWQFRASDGGKYASEYHVRAECTTRLRGVLLHLDDEDTCPRGNDVTAEQVETAFHQWQPNMQRANQLLGRRFDVTRFDSPQKWRWSLLYPVRHVEHR